MATRKISTRLILEGEKEYRQQIRNINRELKTLQSELKLVDSNFKGQANTIAALEAKNKALNDLIAKQSQKLQEEQRVLASAKAARDSYAAMLGKARSELEKLKSATATTAAEQKELDDKIKKTQQELAGYEVAAAKASAAIENHTQRANAAQIALNGFNSELEENTKHLNEAEAAADKCATSIDEYGKEIKEVAESEPIKKESIDGVEALATALAASGIKAAIDDIAEALRECSEASLQFESAMAGVAKTTNLSKDELAAMGENIKEITLRIPIAANEFARIVEVAGQLGIAKENLLDFSKVMADLGVSTNMSADEAATMLAQFSAITGMDAGAYSNLGSAIVELGNNFATNEQRIVDMAQGLAGAATNAGICEADILALSASISSLGMESALGGTAMSTLIREMQSAVETGKSLDEWAAAAGMSATEFSALWRYDATDAVKTFIGGLNDLDASASVTLSTLGITEARMVRMITSLANAEESNQTLSRAIDMSNIAWRENNALAKEAQTRYDTTESKFTLFKNSVNNLKIAIGDQLNPALARLADVGTSVTKWATELIEQNEAIVPLVSGLIVGLGVVTAGLTGLALACTVGAKAVKALSAAMAANPALLVATLIAGLVASLITFVAMAPDASKESDNLSAAYNELKTTLKETKEAYDALIGDIDAERDSTLGLIDSLELLMSAENQDANTKKKIVDIVSKLNDAIPGLGLIYDENTGSLNRTTESLKTATDATANYAKTSARIDDLSKKYAKQREAAANLAEAQEQIAVWTERAEKARITPDNWLSWDLGSTLTAQNNLKEFQELARKFQTEYDALTAEIADLQEEYGLLVDTSSESAVVMESDTQRLLACVDALESAYIRYAQEARLQIDSVIGMWAKMDNSAVTSVKELQQALDSQVEYLKSYTTNLSSLANRNVEGVAQLVKNLSDGSTESAAILAGLSSATDEEIAKIIETLGEVSKGKDSFAHEVGLVRTEMDTALDGITADIQAKIGEWDLYAEASEAGKKTAQGYLQGLRNGLATVFGIKNRNEPSHSAGLDYVPYDDYTATLHKGEMVLTALEARAFRARESMTEYYSVNNSKTVKGGNVIIQAPSISEGTIDYIIERVNRGLLS